MAKRLARAYEPGRRSDTWRKIKIRHAQEFVVCGWIPGTGRRGDTVGSLVLGCHRDGVLTWVGNVGTGLTDADLRHWRDDLGAAEVETDPFAGSATSPSERRPMALRTARKSVRGETLKVRPTLPSNSIPQGIFKTGVASRASHPRR